MQDEVGVGTETDNSIEDGQSSPRSVPADNVPSVQWCRIRARRASCNPNPPLRSPPDRLLILGQGLPLKQDGPSGQRDADPASFRDVDDRVSLVSWPATTMTLVETEFEAGRNWKGETQMSSKIRNARDRPRRMVDYQLIASYPTS